MKGSQPFMIVGSPGGDDQVFRTMQTLMNVVDFGMNVQEAIDAPRVHHQWLPDQLLHERFLVSPDTLALLAGRGHALVEVGRLGVVEAIVYDAKQDLLEGGSDRRVPDGAAVGH
jgi:gamma-glutamyltranspeptidase/glutathione hydrolase